MPPFASAYFTLSILAALMWWGTPLGWLLVISTLQDAVTISMLLKHGWNEKMHAIKIAHMGVEMFFVVVIIALAAGDKVDELILGIAGPLWALFRAGGEHLNIKTVNVEHEIHTKIGKHIQIVAEMGILGSLFVLWRGFYFEGIALLGYSIVNLIISIRYTAVRLRRVFVVGRVVFLIIVGFIRTLPLSG